MKSSKTSLFPIGSLGKQGVDASGETEAVRGAGVLSDIHEAGVRGGRSGDLIGWEAFLIEISPMPG